MQIIRFTLYNPYFSKYKKCPKINEYPYPIKTRRVTFPRAVIIPLQPSRPKTVSTITDRPSAPILKPRRLLDINESFATKALK